MKIHLLLEYPSLMDIGIMGHCKNNCKICYQGNKDKPNMTLDNFKRIIDESKDYITQVALGGKGDPNLHENFKEILEYCRLNNVVPNYTTSGNGLTEEQVKISKEYCGAVAVSKYDEDFTFRALNLLMDNGIKTNIHYVLSSNSLQGAINILNDNEAAWYGNLFDVNKLNAVIFLLFKPQGNGVNCKELIVSDEGIKEFRKYLSVARTRYKIGIDSCLACRISSVCNDFTEKEKLFIDTCEGSRMSCYVTSDMKFIPCSFEDHNKAISIKESIKDIWTNSGLFCNFRDKLKINPNLCPVEFNQ
jgi:MoaA/NifB/PqqE/SkfB family radical SAM enzyme